MIAVAIIDDNHLVSEGIAALLNQLPDLRVVGRESTGDTLLLRPMNPDVILLDLGLRNGDSLSVATMVRQELPESKLIVMDLFAEQEELAEFILAGVTGFVPKDTTLEDLVSTIRLVAKGGRVLLPETGGSLYSRIARAAVIGNRSEHIDSVRMTAREREVIDLIAEGLSNREIAERLDVASHTVKSHVRNIMEKLVLHTRLQIAAYAHKDRAS